MTVWSFIQLIILVYCKHARINILTQFKPNLWRYKRYKVDNCMWQMKNEIAMHRFFRKGLVGFASVMIIGHEPVAETGLSPTNFVYNIRHQQRCSQAFHTSTSMLVTEWVGENWWQIWAWSLAVLILIILDMSPKTPSCNYDVTGIYVAN